MPRTRRPRPARRLAVIAGCATALAVLAGSLPGDAGAEIAAGDGSARSQAAEVTPGAGLTVPAPTVTVLPGTGGALGVLGTTASGVTSALTTNVVTPLSNALLGLPNAMASSLTAALVGSGFQATNAGGQQPRPASGYPTCGQRGWTGSNCYGPLVPAVTAPPVVVLSGGTVQGYATGDAAGYYAAARAANPVLSVLGFPLGDLGVAASSASCATTAASCSATQSLTGGSLLQGKLTYSLADGGALIAKVNNAAVPAAGVPLDVAGFATKVVTNGSLLTITVGLTLTQLLTALGLPNLLSAVPGLGVLGDNGTAATMTIKVGPGQVSQGSPASAWGVEVSVDLSADVELKLGASVTLPLLGTTTVTLATVSVKTATTSPSLVGLKLAYSTATAGSLLPGWVPPAVI